MARTIEQSGIKAGDQGHDTQTFQANGEDRIDLPSSDLIADAKMTREGDNLVLETSNGETAVIEGYFSADPAPILYAPGGSVLTPNLVQSFVHSPMEFAANETSSDQSPVGAVEEVKGHATVTRADGTVETIMNGTPIYQGDVIETDAAGAVNIVFMDETSMSVSANARLAIDEYTYDPSTESGTTNFSVLRGLFVFTSGLIGRDDPDDVKIDTPVGSIGIRGTIIAGEINPGGESNISVLEGAIVIKNGVGEITLSEQFESVRLMGFEQPMKDIGVVPASEINTRFSSISDVNPSLFTMINDTVKEQSTAPAHETPKMDAAPEPTSSNEHGSQTSQQAESTTSAQSNETAAAPPAPALAPDVFASIDSSVPAFDTTTSSGLPSSGTIAGATSTGLGSTTTATTGTALSPAPVGTVSAPTTTAPTTSTTGSAVPTAPETSATPPSVLGTAPPTGTGPSTTRPLWADINLDAVVTASHHLISDNIDNKFGYSISALGDIDGDGFDDFIAGNDVTNQNHSYIFSGSRTGIMVPNAADADIVLNNTSTYDSSGSIVAGIGDFNGDGVKDFVVGQFSNGLNDEGQIRFNSTTGTPISGPIITGPAPTSYLGDSIDAAGDYNNDGYADIIVGAPGANSGDGYIKIYWGQSATPNGPGAPGYSNAALGTDVAGIGDFNGDGYSDSIAGAPGVGEARIFWGSTGSMTQMALYGSPTFGQEVAGLGDINGDGYSDALVATDGNTGAIFFGSATPDANRDISISMPMTYNVSGGGKAGDFNGDGYDDFTISLTNASGTEGYIVLGKASFGSTIDYNYLQDYHNAIKFNYSGAVGADELEITAVGDVNGDGYDDIGIGVPDANGAANGNGGIIVVYGRDTGNITTGPTATANNQSLVGDSYNGSLRDGGFSGISMRGGAGRDIFEINNTNFLGIDGGGNVQTGGSLNYDYIRTIGYGNNLNFSNINFEKISGIEALHMHDNNQTVTLSLENIFNLMKTSDDGIFRIANDGTGNKLILTDSSGGDDYSGSSPSEIIALLDGYSGGPSSPTYQGTVPESGHNYSSFKIGGYTLMIDQSLTVDAQ
jgi:hypothetical protein